MSVPSGAPRRGLAGVAALAAGLALAVSQSVSASAEEKPAESHRSSLVERWIEGRLSIGLRASHFWLEDSRRSDAQGYDNGNLSGNFLGSLWGLDPEQRYLPSPFLEYRVVSSFGVGTAYDRARVRTLDWGNDAHTVTAGDGDFDIRGLQVYAFGRYSGWTRVTPYAQLGFAQYWSRFFVSPGWAAPGRRFVVDGTEGWLATAGVRLALGRHAGVDLQYRHLDVADVAGRAYLRNNHYRAGGFPVRSDWLGVGLAYAF